MRKRLHTLLPILALLAALAAGAPPATARGPVLRASLADGAVLPEAPREVRLWLSETAIPGSDAVVLTDSAGRALPGVTSRAEQYQPTRAGLGDEFDAFYLYTCSLYPQRQPSLLVIDLPELGPGAYQLTWSARSSGRALRGSLVFSIRPGAPPPPTGQEPTPQQAPPVTVQADDLLATLALRPGVPGPNFIDLRIVSTRRPAPRPIDRVNVQLFPPGHADPHVRADAEPLGEGRYRVAGAPVDIAGEWRVSVTVQRAGMPDDTFEVPWTIREADAGTWRALAADALGPALLAGALLAAVATLQLVAMARAWRRERRSNQR
jgi:methionine-rich copper-binding protein CopC